MADEIKKDTVDYRDPTPFDGSKLQSISEISKAIRHKYYGVDTREALAQQGESLVKLIQETGGNQAAEVVAARGNHELLQMREDAQDGAIVKAQSTANSKFDANQAESYLKSVTAIPETFASLTAIKDKYPSGKNGLMVAADNGHKYIWTNGAWTDAGIYQSVGVADGSISSSKLNASAQVPIFTPSKDGLPNYDSKTHILDLNCVNDNAYFTLSNKTVSVPNGTTVLDQNGANGFSSSKLIYDTSTTSFWFTAWNVVLSNTQTLLGTIRKSSQGYTWSGLFDITIDGKKVDQYNIPANVTLSIGRNGLPNFDTETKSFDFKSGDMTTPTLTIGDRVISIPAGTIATASDQAKYANSLRLVYNVANNTAQVIAWNDPTPGYCVTIASILMNYADGYVYISGGFPYTVDGVNQNANNNSIIVIPSQDGAPIFDSKTMSLDMNCYSYHASIIYDRQAYVVPAGTKIVPPEPSGRIRYLFKPSTADFKAITGNAVPDFGWIEFASVQFTENNEVLINASFPVNIEGASFKSLATINAADAKVLGIIHRGFNTVAPEESKSAYLLAKKNGYCHWEGDINWTRDNVPVMIHDDTINRTARNADGSIIEGTVSIADINYADLASYDFGIIKGTRYTGEQLLTFEDLVKLARYNDAYLHIEFKYEFTQDQVQQLYDTVKKYNMLDRVSWQAFGWDWLKQMMALHTDGQFELLGGTINADYLAKLKSYKTDTNTIVASQAGSNSVENIQMISDAGFPIYLWTVDDGATVRKFRDIGMVEGFMTNGAINVADELAKL